MMLDFISAEVLPIGRAGLLNPFDDKIFLNAEDFLLEDEKIVSRFIFFSKKNRLQRRMISAHDSIDGLDRILVK